MSASLSRRPTQGNAIRQFPCLSIPNPYDFSLSPCPVIFTATEDDDFIIDSNYDDIFNTLGGIDIVMASTGNDLVEGGQGQDVLAGGDGNDTLYGGAGNDIGYGGDGDDFLYGQADDGPLFVGGYSFDTITDYQAGDLIDAPNASGTITTSAGTVSSSAGKTI